MTVTVPLLRPVTETALITLIYYATAQLGFMLALPPGNVTPVWPPSAIALALGLIIGYRASAGVWLGSFLVNSVILSDAAGLLAAAGIACGSTLQMCVGAWLLWRVVPALFMTRRGEGTAMIIPITSRDIGCFVALSAFSSLIAASAGVTILWAAKFAPWSNFPSLWATWWLGDYAGILIFTPILLVIAGLVQKRFFAEPILFSVATVCIGLALVAAAVIWQAKVNQSSERLQSVAEDMVGQIRGAIDSANINLIAVEGFFAASDKVTRDEFKHFTSRLLAQNPTTFGLSWRPRVKASEVTSYVAEARKDGIAAFAIFEQDERGKPISAAPRAEYFPIYFNESPTTQSNILGYDIGSDPARIGALARARDSADVIATPPTRRVGQRGEQKNIVLQKALYRGGSPPESIQGRRENLIGYVQSVLRMDGLVRQVLVAPAFRDMEIYLFDNAVVDRPQLIVAHRSSTESQKAEPAPKTLPDLGALNRDNYHEISFPVGGRPWLAVVRPKTELPGALWDWQIWIIILGGLILSGSLLVYLSQRQRSDAELKIAEDHYRNLFDSAPAMYVITHPEQARPMITDCNQLFLTTLGYPREEVVGYSLSNFHTPSSQRQLLNQGAYAQALDGETVEGERELVTKAGVVIPVVMRGEPQRDRDGSVVGTRAMYVDITERKRAEEQFRLVVESAPNGMLMIDSQGKILLVNRQIEQQFSYDRVDLLGQSVEILVPQRFRNSHPQYREKFFADPQARAMGRERELFGLRKDGSEFPIEIGLNPIQIAGDSRVLASVVDISERKRTDDALRHSEATTNMLIDSAPDAMLAVDEDGHIVRVNKQTEQLFGYERDDLIGKQIERLLTDRVRSALRQYRDDYVAASPAHSAGTNIELVGLHKDGGQFAVEVMLNRIEIGGTLLFMATVRDIRHRKAAEVAIQQLTTTLEERVVARTAALEREITERKNVESALTDAYSKLEESVSALEKRNQEITLLSDMIQLVECCQDGGEAYQVISRHLSRLLRADGGALYMISSSRNLVECVAQWGNLSGGSLDAAFAPKECWALRRGRAHKVDSPIGDMLCPHVELGDEPPSAYVCMPLIAHSDALGILHIKYGGANGVGPASHDERLTQAVVEQLSLVLGNLRLRETLSEQSIRDPLTGLFNRRYLEEALQRDLQRAKRSGNSLTVAMVDVDHFKRFNDTFGHAAGDVVLREVAHLIKSKMRTSDVVCRYGGEEFAIISPEMTLDVARQKMDRMREELKRLTLKYQDRTLDTPTISVGLAAFPIHGGDGEALLQTADAALYRAKKEGRDRVVLFAGAVNSPSDAAG